MSKCLVCAGAGKSPCKPCGGTGYKDSIYKCFPCKSVYLACSSHPLATGSLTCLPCKGTGNASGLASPTVAVAKPVVPVVQKPVASAYAKPDIDPKVDALLKRL